MRVLPEYCVTPSEQTSTTRKTHRPFRIDPHYFSEPTMNIEHGDQRVMSPTNTGEFDPQQFLLRLQHVTAATTSTAPPAVPMLALPPIPGGVTTAGGIGGAGGPGGFRLPQPAFALPAYSVGPQLPLPSPEGKQLGQFPDSASQLSRMRIGTHRAGIQLHPLRWRSTRVVRHQRQRRYYLPTLRWRHTVSCAVT